MAGRRSAEQDHKNQMGQLALSAVAMESHRRASGLGGSRIPPYCYGMRVHKASRSDEGTLPHPRAGDDPPGSH